MEKQIIIVRPKTLSKSDKAKLTKAGIVVIEHENPLAVHTMPDSERMEYVREKCHSCGDRIYLTKERLEALKESNRLFYCPQGHSQSFI